VFTVPVIAHYYVKSFEVTLKATVLFLNVMHQFNGVLLGEHIGQLFTIMWMVMVFVAILKLKLMPKWISIFGIAASSIYLLAQAELFKTIIAG
jgi:Domain of unknown function (DUF4386)